MSLLTQPKPDYETISYVWGDQQLRGTIRICGKAMDVPASSEVVLKRMRYPREKRLLWIGAVCINQKDPIERGEQVSFMHEIYTNGSKNLIWLGKGDEYTGQALADMQKLVDEFRDEANNYQDAQNLFYDDWGARKYSSTPLSCEIQDWKALRRFFENPRFSRLWVVQEASFSPRNVCFIGKFDFELRGALRAAMWIRYKRYQIIIPTAKWTMYPTQIATFTDRICSNSGQLARVRKASFLAVIQQLAQFEVSDTRDHVYGTIGLFQRHSGNQEIPPQLLPDYTLPTAVVFRNATKLGISRKGGVSVICNITNWPGDDFSEWPSWVPYWHRSATLNDHLSDFASLFDASNESRQNLPLPDVHDENIIGLAGLTADNVVNMSSPMPYMRSGIAKRDETEVKKILQVSRALALGTARDLSDAELVEIVATTLTYSTDGQKRRVNEKSCAERYEAFATFLARSARPEYKDRHLSENTTASSALASDFYMAMRRACSNRCVFSTTSGRLGVGPARMQPGDTVAILYGGEVPLILRPSQRYSRKATHELVGNCYVHGIMDGEAVLEHKAVGKEDEWFYLR